MWSALRQSIDIKMMSGFSDTAERSTRAGFSPQRKHLPLRPRALVLHARGGEREANGLAGEARQIDVSREPLIRLRTSQRFPRTGALRRRRRPRARDNLLLEQVWPAESRGAVREAERRVGRDPDLERDPGRERRCERASRLATEREDVRELRSGRVRSDVFERDLGVLEVVEKDVRGECG